ncbi:hypothetical protein K2Y00_00700 [Patescibacteria group bacterium]|nr:hypothetical protein [Patescibacteria group bacterium]
MEKVYASALERLLSQGVKEDALMKNLMTHLKARGRVKLLPAILRSLKVAQIRNTVTGATVEVARKEDAAKALSAAATHGITADKAIVNESLLSGWRGRSKGVLVDQSGKRALTDIYQRVVKV